MFIAKRFFKELLPQNNKLHDASGSSGGGAGRELASEYVKRVTESMFPTYRTMYVWECLERKNK